MKTRIRVLVVGLVLLAPTPGATGATGTTSNQRPEFDPRVERWNQMNEEERDLFRRRFELLRQMHPERRAELLERWEKLKRVEEELREEEGDWEPSEDLDEPDRRRAWRKHVHHRLRERGKHMRGIVPPFVQRQLDEAPPHMRRRMLKGFRRGLVRRFGPRLMNEIGRRLQLSPEEVERLEQMPVDERMKELRRLSDERRRERRGYETDRRRRKRPGFDHDGPGRRGHGPPGRDPGRRPGGRYSTDDGGTGSA